MVDRVMFSSERMDWGTPQWLYDELDKEFNFEVDLAASRSNRKHRIYLGPKSKIATDALTFPWADHWKCGYLNPPYGRGVINWVKKAYEESQRGMTVVILLASRTDTKWFHEYILPFGDYRFIRGRLKHDDQANPATFPSMVVVFSPPAEVKPLPKKSNKQKPDADPLVPLSAPFPWFGGKRRVADKVWEALGDVRNYVEPFYGSGAVLLSRPQPFDGVETINDKDALVSNFWRAIQSDPEKVAKYADWIQDENDLHARHAWLVRRLRKLRERVEGDPDYYSVKIAGWWVHGICLWIGSGYCSGKGPWTQNEGQLLHLGNYGQGINRQRLHLGDYGQGINRQLLHLGDYGQGIIHEWFRRLSERLKRVRIASGDWKRVTGPSVTTRLGLTGVFLDPPYSEASRTDNLYREDTKNLAAEVQSWCREHQHDNKLRIVLCGYEGEYDLPEWQQTAWKAPGGYGSQGEGSGRDNCSKERIWFSPNCLEVSEKLARLKKA